MKSLFLRLAVCALVLAVTGLGSVRADTIDKDWTFSQPGNVLGWNVVATCIPSFVVGNGYLGFDTVDYACTAYLVSPDSGGIPASRSHYVSIKMRMRYSSGPKDRFGPIDTKVYFSTIANPSLSDKYVAFKTYGNGEWKVYNIYTGNHASWTGTISRLRLVYSFKPSTRAEIAWVRIVRDETPPEYEIRNMWNPRDNDYVTTTTPSITLRKICDSVSGLNRCDFYYRPGASSDAADWVYVGSDGAGDGLQFKYPALPEGTYDFGVRIFDNAGNWAGLDDGSQGYIDDVTIDPSRPTRLLVDASNVLDRMPREILGNNILWSDWTNKYNAATGLLTPNLEAKVSDMLIGNMRYSGADEFDWKSSIGPVELRPPQYFLGADRIPKFGLDEFLRYCETHGIEPILGVKFRWPGGPGQPIEGPDPYAKCLQDAIDLVEYCNTPNDGSNPNGGTDWAAVRAANGHPEPYNVKWFELGNEPWGYDTYGSPSRYGYSIIDAGGLYGAIYYNYYDGMTSVDPNIVLAATAYQWPSYTNDWANPDWSRVVYHMNASRADVIQVHPYVPYSAWQKDLNELYLETMATPKYMDDYIHMHRSFMRITAPEKTTQMKLRFDEWNINYNWIYDPSIGRINTWHTKTLKAAVAAADTLRVFIENRDAMESSGWWHLYCGGWACITCDDVTVYPVYHVYRMMKHHLGDLLVKSIVQGSPVFDFTKANGGIIPAQWGVPCITAMASRSSDGDTLYLMVINAHKTNSISVDVNIANFLSEPWSQLSAEIWELNGPDVDDYDHPNNIKITESTSQLLPDFVYSFPPHSVTTFKLKKDVAIIDRIGDVKGFADRTSVVLSDKVVTRRIGQDVLYVEEPERIAGIRVSGVQADVNPNDSILVRGKLATTLFGERYVAADFVESRYVYGPIAPWAMNLRALAAEPPVTTGLLVRVWGVVGGSGDGFFYLNDGSNAGDPAAGGAVKVISEAAPGDGAFVCVTGVKSLDAGSGGNSVPVILTGTTQDVQVVWQP